MPSPLPTFDPNVTIGIDVGTQSTKLLVYRPSSSEVIFRSSRAYDLDPVPPGTVPSGRRAEQSPSVWTGAVRDVLDDAAAFLREAGDRAAVAAIGVSGQQHGLVPLDAGGSPLRPAKLWCDTEAHAEADFFSRAAGRVVPPGFTAPKALWMARHEPEHWGALRWTVLPHDYVTLCLTEGLGGVLRGDAAGTGRPVRRPTTDAGDASGTGVFDAAARRFDEHLAAAVGEKFFGTLPRVLGPSEPAGVLHGRLRDELFPGQGADVVVSCGSGDNMCAALGAGCVRPGRAVLSLGTSGTIFGVSDAPVVDPGGTVAPFCDATGRHLPLVCTMSCAAVLDGVLAGLELAGTEGVGARRAAAERAAGAVAPGCCGVNFLPYLEGERTPNFPEARGALLGLAPGQLGNAGLLYRAAVEGVTYTLLDAFHKMRDTCPGFDPSELLVVGGGSRSKFWCQIVSDSFGLPLSFPAETEAAALGAALQAGACARGMPVAEFVEEQNLGSGGDTVFPSGDEETKRMYREAFERHVKLTSALFS